jgi:CDP-diacylglycerol--glycerol-3-phosphate 3-phosphatidyltransferase
VSAGSTPTRPTAAGGYKERLKVLAHGVLDPVVAALARAGFTPNHLTVAGFVLSLGAAIAFFQGKNRVAAVILVFAGLFDILDGQVARRTGKVTAFGAFFDSTLDRVADAALLVGIAGYFAHRLALEYVLRMQEVAGNRLDGPTADKILRDWRDFADQALPPDHWVLFTLLAVLALVGSFMVSYTRARAEGLGLECKVGWFERPERIVLLIAAGLIDKPIAMEVAVLLLAVFSLFTAVQRMAHVYKLTRPAGSDSDTTEA